MLPGLVRRGIAGALAVVIVFAAGSATAADVGDESDRTAERVAPPLDPREMGLALPREGQVEPGEGRRVIAPDENGKPVVGQLHCKIGKGCLVVLPSGKLKAVAERDTTPTDKPFTPLSGKELTERLQAGGLGKFTADTSDHYAYLYACDEKFYRATRDILETLYDGVLPALKQWKLEVHDPQVPLVVLIMPNRATFDAFHPMPPDVAAYYSAVSNYVILYEEPELSDAAPERALKRAAYTIAHEGVHQILHNVGVQQRLAPWPAWISEGLAELFCPVRVSSKMVKKGSDSMPQRRVRWNQLGLVNDLRMYDLLPLKSDKGAMLRKIVLGKELDADGYALAWGLTHYLYSKKAKQFQAYLRDVAAIEPLADLDPGFERISRKLFADDVGNDFAQLEADVGRYLTSPAMQTAYRDPYVYQTHYLVVHTALRGKAAEITVLITTSPDDARRWKKRRSKTRLRACNMPSAPSLAKRGSRRKPN